MQKPQKTIGIGGAAKHVLLLCACVVVGMGAVSQTAVNDSVRSGYLVTRYRLVDNDTVPHVDLKEIAVVPPYRFKNKRQKARYSKLVYNVKVVLPYARKAGAKVNEINTELALIKDEKARKKYLKEKEKELFAEFEEPLKKLSYSQGRLLIKLINRETGNTTYDLIKEYKGGVSAFFWQSVARLFGSNLKSEFDKEGDDHMIEHIIILIDSGLL